MKKLLLILFLFCSVFANAQTWNTGWARPVTSTTLQTPNNVTFYINKLDTSFWARLGTMGDIRLLDSAYVYKMFVPYRDGRDSIIIDWPVISPKFIGDTTQINDVFIWQNDTILKDSLAYFDVRQDSVRLRYINGSYSKWYLSGDKIKEIIGDSLAIIFSDTAKWNAAYRDKINSLAFTGTTTKTLTLTQQDGGTVTGNFTDLVDDADADPTNELQDLSISNDTLLLSNSTAKVSLKPYLTTLGTANGLSLNGQELSLGLASTSTNGALSSTDWDMFNGKAPASGSANYIQNQNSAAQTANLWIDGNAKANTLQSTVVTGTAPLTVASTTMVSNLNAEYLGGHNAAYFQPLLTNPITGTGAAGQVAFWNGTSTQTGDNGLFWDNTNKMLGIGTTGPLSKLHINDGTNRNLLVTTDATQMGTTGIAIGSFNDGATAYAPLSILGSTISINGNVGIGTTNPGAKLEVNSGLSGINSDGLYVGHSANAGYNVLNLHSEYGDGGGGNLLSISNWVSTKFLIDNNGNVGIGTNSPASKLDVVGSHSDVSLNYNSQALANFRAASHTQLAISSQLASPYTLSLQGKHSILDGYSYPIALNPLGGNVGILKTDPATALDVNGTTTSSVFKMTTDAAAGAIPVSSVDGTMSWKALGTASQILRVNSGATGLEYFTPNWIDADLIDTTGIANNDLLKYNSTSEKFEVWSPNYEIDSVTYVAKYLKIYENGAEEPDSVLIDTDVQDNAVSYNKLASDLKRRSVVTNFVDFSADAIGTISLTANTTFSFSNLQINKVYTLIIDTNGYEASFPAYCSATTGSFEILGDFIYYLDLRCFNSSSGSEEVLYTVFHRKNP